MLTYKTLINDYTVEASLLRSWREQLLHFRLLTVVEVKRILRSVWNFSSGYWLLGYYSISILNNVVWWCCALFYYTTIGVCCPALLISVAFCIVYVFLFLILTSFRFRLVSLCPMLSTLPCSFAFLFCFVHCIAVLLPLIQITKQTIVLYEYLSIWYIV